MKRSLIRWAVAALVIALLILCFTLLPWESYPVLNRAVAGAQKSLAKPLLHLGHVSVSPAFLLKAFVFLILLVFVARRGRHLFRDYVLDRLGMAEGHKYALETGAEYVMVIAGLAIGLQSAGIDLSSLALVGELESVSACNQLSITSSLD